MSIVQGFGRGAIGIAAGMLLGLIPFLHTGCDRKQAQPPAMRMVEATSTILPGFRRATGTGDPEQPREVDTLSLSNDGSRLALSASWVEGGAAVQVWDLSGSSPTKICEFKGNEATLSPDGKWVAYLRENPGYANRSVFLSEVGGTPRHIAKLGCVFRVRLTFAPGGALIATMVDCGSPNDHRSRVICWDSQQRERFSYTVGEKEESLWFSWPFAGATLVATAHKGAPPTIKVWDISASKVSRTYPGSGKADDYWMGVAVSADGRLMASKMTHTDLSVTKLPGGETVCAVPSRLLAPFDVFEFDPSGSVLLYAGKTSSSGDLWGKDVVGIETGSGAPIMMFKGHEDVVTAIAVSGDGSIMATASKDGTVKLWNFGAAR